MNRGRPTIVKTKINGGVVNKTHNAETMRAWCAVYNSLSLTTLGPRGIVASSFPWERGECR